MTISELADRSGRSVSQIIAWAHPGKSGESKTAAPKAAPKKPAAKAPAAPSTGGGKNVNTRTPEGRAAYDVAVLNAVTASNKPIGSSKLRKAIGGTPLQLRTALNRLIEDGKVTYQGKARATKYSLR